MDTLLDLLIIGGGPAGSAAAVYAARKRLKTVFVTYEWGGQSTVSTDIQNWIGTPSISGNDLAKSLRTHVEHVAGDTLTLLSPVRALSVATFDDHVEVVCSNGNTYKARTLLVATGANRRKLEVPGAAEYDQKGLTYCASCDGPLFSGQDVVVIGGGNAAFESALQLLAYCKSVTLLNRTETFRADEVTVAAAKQHENFKIITSAETTLVSGGQFVTGITYKDQSGEHQLAVQGIFVEIGLVPNTEWIGEGLELTPTKQIVVDPRTGKASHPRVWAAGDVTNSLYHQNNIAAGDAVKALEDIYVFVKKDA